MSHRPSCIQSARKRWTRSSVASAATALLVGVASTGPAIGQDHENWLSDAAVQANPLHPYNWTIHDPDRPHPPMVDPGPGPEESAPVPEDAVVLFDGEDFDQWNHDEWEILEDGSARTVPGTSDLYTNETFGDVQLWVEYMVDPEDETNGNSGVFLGDYGYEVQILDNYHEPGRGPADSMNASMYAQYPPLVNASRPRGEWQTYNIIYRNAEFDDAGELVSPATFTVFHNNLLVHHEAKLVGPTSHAQRTDYQAHGEVPIMLQEHGSLVRFRNVWVRELDE